MNYFSNIYEKKFRKKLFFGYIYTVYFFRDNFISNTICIIVYLRNIYLFIVALSFPFFKATILPYCIDKGRISPQTFKILINILRLFYERICIYFMQKTINKLFQYS